MKNILIIGLIFLSFNLFAQRPGNEKMITWTVAHKDTCWVLDNIGEGHSVALQIEELNMLNGYFKLFGKSSTASAWVQYGSGVFTSGSDSINIPTLLAHGLTSCAWLYENPILYSWKACFYHVTDTVGTIKIHETIMKK
jgi:hypothetical protein